MPVDPSAIKTWANLVTVARILIAPFMFLLIPDHPGGRWVAFLLWFFLCSSDGIDGYLARRTKQISRFGRFLDPIADKLLVAAVLLLLVGFGRLTLWAYMPALIILLREIMVSGLREYLAELRVSVPVSRLAKWKTTWQLVAVGFLIAGDAGDQQRSRRGLPGTRVNATTDEEIETDAAEHQRQVDRTPDAVEQQRCQQHPQL